MLMALLILQSIPLLMLKIDYRLVLLEAPKT